MPSPDAAPGGLSSYEQARLDRIAHNKQVLTELGIHELVSSSATVAPLGTSARGSRKRQRVNAELLPQRQSLRARGAEPPESAVPLPAAEAPSRAAREEPGARDEADGKWIGERFGEISSVKVGKVFGAGDYQRKGRFEMAASGFFAPTVQPEWLEPGRGCFALILNNDNGLSRDEGHKIVYAGGGGRHRGQNRSAPQSFHQSWENLTNATLRLNLVNGLPVRVIRGPKLLGEHSTTASGTGGYRYDGLYHVTEAELVPCGPRLLRTALFTLEKKH